MEALIADNGHILCWPAWQNSFAVAVKKTLLVFYFLTGLILLVSPSLDFSLCKNSCAQNALFMQVLQLMQHNELCCLRAKETDFRSLYISLHLSAYPSRKQAISAERWAECHFSLALVFRAQHWICASGRSSGCFPSILLSSKPRNLQTAPQIPLRL